MCAHFSLIKKKKKQIRVCIIIYFKNYILVKFLEKERDIKKNLYIFVELHL